MLRADRYKSFVRDIDADIGAEFDAECDALKRKFADQRRKAIEALNEAWPKMGGSEEDLISPTAELPFVSAVERQPDDQRRESGRARNGASRGRTVPMMVVRQEVRNALQDTKIEIITQSYLKDRLLQKYPDAKIGSLAPALSRTLSQLTEHGELELVEKGVAGAPHKYRKRADRAADSTEESLLGP